MVIVIVEISYNKVTAKLFNQIKFKKFNLGEKLHRYMEQIYKNLNLSFS